MRLTKKLNIKNTQIAGAINLRGLKEKFSKKKPEEESPDLASQEEALKSKKTAAKKEVKSRATKEKTKEIETPIKPEKQEKEVLKEVLLEKPQEEAIQSKPAPIIAKTEGPAIAQPSAHPTPPIAAPASHEVRPTPTSPKIEEKTASPARYEERREDFRRDDRSGYQRPPYRPHSGGYPPRHGGGYQGGGSGGSGYQQRQAGPHGSSPHRTGPYQQRGPSQYPPRGGQPPYRREGGGPPFRREGGAPPYRREGGAPPYRREGGAPYREGGRPPYQGPRPFVPRPFSPSTFPPRDGFTKDEGRQRPFREERPRKPMGEDQSKTANKGRPVEEKTFDARTRHGLVEEDEGEFRRRRRPKSGIKSQAVQEIIRPSKITIRLPIILKDLAQEMKLKSSELVQKLFLQGMVVTLNDMLDDETTVQLLGHEFGCEIIIDTSEEARVRISDKKVREEILQSDPSQLILRPPVVAFMGHVDHGKTSLIDAIRKSNRAAKEVGAITQHIGAFKCQTQFGPIAILDTPGHEAFSLMRERGAEVTDIVVLVVAGDEGVQEQTVEAINIAKSNKATIVVAITKSDKPSYNPELVYRQLSEHELLPEAWGGQTITINCSVVSGKGIQELLEMLALQAEVLELKANPNFRARGTVIESEMQQGHGAVATVLVQNGTLRLHDSLVFGSEWAKVKSMRDEHGIELKVALPSTPVQITGLSGLPEAGDEFIVVKNEKEASEIAEARKQGRRENAFLQSKKKSLETMMEKAKAAKKILPAILRTDVQGSLEALRKALERIHSDKVELNIISQGVGQISESDVLLAATSGACIIGFHTAIEAHAEPLVKEHGVQVYLHDIIYHAVDKTKELMKGLLDKIAQESDKGKAEVKAIFKSSQLGFIAGCQVTEGSITRNSHIRVRRGSDIIWRGPIGSLKRVKDDVKEVQKGLECGILLQGFQDVKAGDILEAYDVQYIEQEL